MVRYPVPPRWVTEALSLGFRGRGESVPGQPFFGLISTPAESCMAGLIALGAELRALSHRQAGRAVDAARYFSHLRGLKDGTVLRVFDQPGRRYALVQGGGSNGTSSGCLRARRLNLRHEQFRIISESTCLNWLPEGEVPENTGGYDGLWLPPEAATLRALLPAGEEIAADRLRLNSPEVVLVGPPGGTPAFQSVYEEHCAISALDGEEPVPLSRLLGLRGFHESEHAFRGVFINALSPSCVGDSSAAARRAVLVVFDGAAPFLKLGDYFNRCDRVVVASRCLSNSLLERLCGKLHQDQYDSGAVAENGTAWANMPHGIQTYRSRVPGKEVRS